MKQGHNTSESLVHKSVYRYIPSVLMMVSLIVLVVSQTLYDEPSPSSSFDAFLFAALSNLAILVYLQKFINYKGKTNDSGYGFFYIHSFFLVYALITQQSWISLSYLVFFQILLYRLATRLRYGGVPIISFVFNAVAIYAISIGMTIGKLSIIYFFVQLIEGYFLSRYNERLEVIALQFGWLLFVGYLVFLAIILKV